MTGPELSVVCKSCGSEVSPYVTECPYCGTRLRKRAPKIERVGDEVRVREGRADRRRRKAAERRSRLAARRERAVEDLALRPIATILALAIPAVALVVERGSGLDALDLGAIAGSVDGEWWRYFAAPFVFEDMGYLIVCALAFVIFLPPIERRVGTVATAFLVVGTGALGMLAADGLDSSFGDGIPIAAGGNGIALGALGAWFVIRSMERRADPDDEGFEWFAVAVAAAVLLALPLVEDWADPWAGIAGGLVGAACGFAAALRRGPAGE